MSKQTINLGTVPTGVGGDTPRSAFTKTQSNFDEIYAALGASGNPGTLPASLPVAQGGTGGTTAATARSGLGLGSAAVAAVVGTVSQSGGVPSGAIIEQGSNANGVYTKFADGTMLCRGTTPGLGVDQTTTTQAYSSVLTLPATFVGSYDTKLNIIGVNVTNVFQGYCRAANTSASTITIIQYWNFVQTYGYSYLATGRWF